MRKSLAVSAVCLLTACAEVDSGDPFKVSPEAILAGLEQSADWELAYRQVTIRSNDDWRGDEFMDVTDEEREAMLAASEATSPFIAEDGERYEALYVTADGTTFGRRGPAPDMPLPTEENDFGAWAGTEAEQPDVAVTSQAAIIYQNWANDRRSRVTNMTTLSTYPVRATGALTGEGLTQRNGCSATRVGPRSAITVAHCFWNGQDLVQMGFFHPGKTNTWNTNGVYAWQGIFFRDWLVSKQYDYAVITLADSQASTNLGWMGVKWWDTAADYNGRSSFNNGYPCGPLLDCGMTTFQKCKDSAFASKLCDGWMYSDPSTLVTADFLAGNELSFDNDGSKGQSGSALYSTVNGFSVILTIMSGHPGNAKLRGPRFRTSMWNDVCTWIGDPTAQSAFGTHSLCN